MCNCNKSRSTVPTLTRSVVRQPIVQTVQNVQSSPQQQPVQAPKPKSKPVIHPKPKSVVREGPKPIARRVPQFAPRTASALRNRQINKSKK